MVYRDSIHFLSLRGKVNSRGPRIHLFSLEYGPFSDTQSGRRGHSFRLQIESPRLDPFNSLLDINLGEPLTQCADSVRSKGASEPVFMGLPRDPKVDVLGAKARLRSVESSMVPRVDRGAKPAAHSMQAAASKALSEIGEKG